MADGWVPQHLFVGAQHTKEKRHREPTEQCSELRLSRPLSLDARIWWCPTGQDFGY